MSCIKVVETQESFCVIRKFECIEAGGLPILNEFDCPYIEETGRFEVIPSTGILECYHVPCYMHAWIILCGS